jgi:hypothetical protein
MDSINKMTEHEAKQLLNDIADVFSIGGEARTRNVIFANVKNSADDVFCKYKKSIEFLEGTTFRFIKKPNGYIFTRPGWKTDSFGRSIIETIENAIEFDNQ